MINQQIKLLESESEVAVTDEEILAILDKITALIYENGERKEAAEARFNACSEEAQYQGKINACDTAPFTNFEKYGKGDELQYSCEFWEMAATGAEDWDDMNGR